MQRSVASTKPKSNKKKAQGGVKLRQATSSLSIPSTRLNQSSRGLMSKASAPVASSSQQRVRAPIIQRSGKGLRIRHRELVQSINGSVAFTVTRLAINPGLSAVFPWLAPQAAQWEQYRFHKLNFEYVTRTSTATTGSVILAPDYDAADPSPSSESQICAYEDAVEDATWRDILCVLKPDSMHPLGPRKYIRTSSVAGDIKTYDVANFFIATLEEAGATAIGKLWVDYDVEFFVPQNSPSGSSSPDSTSFFIQNATQTLTTGVQTAAAWDTLVFDPLGIGAGSSGTFTPPAGVYDIDVRLVVVDTTAEAFQATAEIFKNNAINSTPIRASYVNGSAAGDGAAQRMCISFRGVVACNGSDTIKVMVTLTGAAGTLRLQPQECQLLWSLA